MNFDEGVCYFTISPSDSNPLLRDLSRFRSNHAWLGVIHPDKYSLIPFQIRFRSLSPKPQEERERFERILSIKIELAWRTAIKNVLENASTRDRFVESWSEVLRGTSILNTDNHIFAGVMYGEVFNSLLQIVVSELIRGMMEIEKKMNYNITVERLHPDAILLGTLHRETFRDRFIQRMYDEDIQVSAYKWDLGVSIRKKYLWKKPWGSFLEPHI